YSRFYVQLPLWAFCAPVRLFFFVLVARGRGVGWEANASSATYGPPLPAIGEHSNVITQFFNLHLSFLSMITDFVLFPFSPLNFRFLFYRLYSSKTISKGNETKGK
ncbi:hypothetical protein KCA24_34790, partial [Escherichia coli]|nr:hypothetical protein [Escherichia coli]